MDRDVGSPSRDDFVWRSAEVERRRALETSGVLDAANHPRYGHRANLRKTLGVCMAALAAVGAMIAIGMQLQENDRPTDEPAAVVAEAGPIEAEAADELISEVSAGPAVQSPAVDLSGLLEEAEPPAAAVEPNRADCQAIRGTAYLSETERIWYLGNCVEEPEPVFASIAGGAVIEPVALAPAAPEQGTGLTEETAIAAGADWIATQSGVSYDVGADVCNASRVGALWLVTCQATLTGCDVEACTSWEAVCVAELDGAVLPTRDC